MFLKSKVLLRIRLEIYSLSTRIIPEQKNDQSRVLLESRVGPYIQHRLKVFSILRHMTYQGRLKVFSELRMTFGTPHPTIHIQSFKISIFGKVKKGRGRFGMSANLDWFKVCFLSSGG